MDWMWSSCYAYDNNDFIRLLKLQSNSLHLKLVIDVRGSSATVYISL